MLVFLRPLGLRLIVIPEEMRKEGRTFFLIRCYEGKTAVVASTTGNVLEGSTDVFSSYLLTYRDEESATLTSEPTVTPTAKPTPTATPKEIPKTGDSGNPALWIGLVVVGLICIGGLILWNCFRKRKEER